MTEIWRSPVSPLSASGSYTPSADRSECSRRAPSWEFLQRSWRHVRPHSEFRDELVGYELTRHDRSILLSPEGGVVQCRRPDLRKTPPSLRHLSWPGPLQFEEWLRSRVPIARRE